MRPLLGRTKWTFLGFVFLLFLCYRNWSSHLEIVTQQQETSIREQQYDAPQEIQKINAGSSSSVVEVNTGTAKSASESSTTEAPSMNSTTTSPLSTSPVKASPAELESSTTTTGIVIGRRYNDDACWLSPSWGHNNSGCVGRNPPRPDTPAPYLTCNNNKNKNNNGDNNNNNPQKTNNEKPNLQDQSHPGMTIALLYFAQPALLFRQLEIFATYPSHILKELTVLVIDDGSPPGLRATDYFNATQFKGSAPFRFRLATILTEKDWNIGGARNLAFYLADTPRVLLLDLDMMVPPETIQTAWTWETMNKTHVVAHRFNRKKKNGQNNKHPAVTVIATEGYWHNGGCDEDFCGNYGYTDVHFWWRWKLKKKRRFMVDHLDTFLHQLDMPSCDETYLTMEQTMTCRQTRNSTKTKPKRALKVNHKIFKQKTKHGCWSNLFLRFEWVLVA